MAYNFFELNGDQRFPLPENTRDWLPEGDLSLFVIDAVERLDLSDFYTLYRSDGRGAAAFRPLCTLGGSAASGDRSSPARGPGSGARRRSGIP